MHELSPNDIQFGKIDNRCYYVSAQLWINGKSIVETTGSNELQWVLVNYALRSASCVCVCVCDWTNGILGIFHMLSKYYIVHCHISIVKATGSNELKWILVIYALRYPSYVCICAL